MSAYADTSFLISLYTIDANSVPAAAEMIKAELPLYLTPFGELEFMNALSLRGFRKEIALGKLKTAFNFFRRDIASGIYFRKSLAGTVYERAERLSRLRTRRWGIRTLDILHVAAAQDLKAKTFYTFDQRQQRLAKAEGLTVLP